MNKVENYYQENSLGSAPEKRELSQEEEEQVKLVQETLSSPGYKILHTLMTNEVVVADKHLWDKKTPLEEIRYYQGMISAIQNVQGKFLSLSKEDGYVRNT